VHLLLLSHEPPQIGSAVFSGDRPKDFNFITETADKNDNIRTPACTNVTDEMRNMIPLTPEWTFWPDYDRVSWRCCLLLPSGYAVL
jgi:hypothetical protein